MSVELAVPVALALAFGYPELQHALAPWSANATSKRTKFPVCSAARCRVLRRGAAPRTLSGISWCKNGLGKQRSICLQWDREIR